MYLEFQDYITRGGTLDKTEFENLERKAEQKINAQASGKTGQRISKLPELPQAITDCTFDLIICLENNNANKKIINSESQSGGGVSESKSYVVKDDESISKEIDNIIYEYFFGNGLGHLLYRGALQVD